MAPNNHMRRFVSRPPLQRLVGHSGPEAAGKASPPFKPERVEIISIITHGRLASCDGYLQAGGKRIDFSHALRFASTVKTAKIAELRSYCVETQVG